MRESDYDCGCGILGSYDPMSVSTDSDFLAREFSMDIVHQISVSVFEGLQTDTLHHLRICKYYTCYNAEK